MQRYKINHVSVYTKCEKLNRLDLGKILDEKKFLFFMFFSSNFSEYTDSFMEKLFDNNLIERL